MTRFRIASPITLVLRYAKMSIDDMLKSNDSIIKILAVLLIMCGVGKILFDAKSIWFAITHVLFSSSINFVLMLYVVVMPLFFIFLISAAAIAGGVGLYQKKKWGWVLSITVSLATFTIYCAGTINFLIASYLHKNISMPSFSEGEHVEYFSMIPTYVITVVSLIYAFVLSRKSLKNECIR